MTHRDDKEHPRGRRKHRRVPTREVTAEVQAGNASYSYTVLNISMGGLLVTGDRCPPLDAALDIEIKRPGAESIALTGQVAHERADDGIGISFDTLSFANSAAIERLIAVIDARAGAPPPLPAFRAPPPLPPAAAAGPPPMPAPAAGPPPVPFHPVDDPFSEGQDPRPPRAGSPDERIEYLRGLVKRRDEALGRGRTAYAAARSEANELRQAVNSLESRLVTALGQAGASETALAAARREAEQRASEAAAERAAASEAMDQETRRTLEAIAAVAGLEGKLKRLEAELSNTRAEAEKALAEAKAEADEALEKTTARYQAELAETRAEAQQTLEKTTARLESELAETRAEAKAALEETTARLEDEISTTKSKAVAAVKAKTRQLEIDNAAALKEAEDARRDLAALKNDAAALRRTREDLVAANKKAIEAQAAFNKERSARSNTEAALAEARAAAQATVDGEKKAAAEIARLKAKLIAAEAALERSASRRKTDPQIRRPGFK